MPLLAQRWPGYRQTFARAAALQMESAEVLQRIALPMCNSIFGDPGMRLMRDTGEWPTSVQLKQSLHAWLTRSGVPVPSWARLHEFTRQLLTARSDRQPELILGSMVLKRWNAAVYQVSAAQHRRSQGAEPTPLSEPRHTFPFSELSVAEDVAGDWGEVHWCKSPASRLQAGTRVTLRSSVAGERFSMPRAARKTFKQLCQERGIPPWWRDSPLIVCHEGLPVAILGIGLLAEGSCDPVNVTNLGYEPRYIPFVVPNN